MFLKHKCRKSRWCKSCINYKAKIFFQDFSMRFSTAKDSYLTIDWDKLKGKLETQ